MFVIWRRLPVNNILQRVPNVEFKTKEQVYRWLEFRQYFRDDDLPIYVFEKVDTETAQKDCGRLLMSYYLCGHDLQEMHKMEHILG